MRVSFVAADRTSSPEQSTAASVAKAKAEQEAREQACAKIQPPVIVPLLVTDDVERAIRSRAAETARQIALALGALTGGFAANAGVNKVDQTLETELGQELNSHLMVSRLSDNTMYARVGGTSDPVSGANLVGQNYNISVLLLVPSAYLPKSAANTSQPVARDIQVVASTELRYAETGEILPDRGSTTYQQQIEAAIDATFPELNPSAAATGDTPRGIWDGLSFDARREQIRVLRSAIERGDFADFVEKAKASTSFAAKADGGDIKSLWARLTGLIADSSFKSAVLNLPDAPAASLRENEVATVFDDTKANAVVVLQNVGWLSNSTLGAVLDLYALRNGTTVRTPFPAQSIALDQKKDTLTLTFPSLVKWGIDAFDEQQSKLHVYFGGCAKGCDTSYAVSLVKAVGAPEEKAAFTFTSQVKAIVPNLGSGSIDVAIDKMDKTKYDAIKISWSGGMFTSAQVASKPLAPDGTAVSVVDNGTVHFTFSNLVPQSPLVLTAEGMKDKKSIAKAAPLQFSINP